MGTGINAAIPIVLRAYESSWERSIDKKYFSPSFFENYNCNEDVSVCTIKPEILLNNFQSFLTEFYALIGERCSSGKMPLVGSYEEFCAIFNRDKRNAEVPFIDECYSSFSVLGGICDEYWIFYSGSYKAYLEEYSTMTHFERVLAKTMKTLWPTRLNLAFMGKPVIRPKGTVRFCQLLLLQGADRRTPPISRPASPHTSTIAAIADRSAFLGASRL